MPTVGRGHLNKGIWRNEFWVLKVCQERDALGDMACFISHKVSVWFLEGFSTLDQGPSLVLVHQVLYYYKHTVYY